MTKTLACGCVIGLYSQIEKWCDRHYQQLLDERFYDDTFPCIVRHNLQTKSVATMNEKDMAYLRNIKTSPPNAGRSIDPTKPGPDADRIAPSPEPQDVWTLAKEAADTIRRELAELGVRIQDDLREPIASEIRNTIRAALAQSDVQLVGWQWRGKLASGEMSEWCNLSLHLYGHERRQHPDWEFRPLYAAPPRPDASGLIEAAEFCRTHVAFYVGGKPVRLVTSASGEPYGHLFADAIEAIRSRAADRARTRGERANE